MNFRAANEAAGANFGWRRMEGSLPYPPGSPNPNDPSLILPIYEYGRTVGATIIGGEVYIGAAADFVGQYVFGDFNGSIFSLRIANGVAIDAVEKTGQLAGSLPHAIVDFAADTAGNLYAIGLIGTIWRLDFGSGAEDVSDILDGGLGNDILVGGAGADRLLGGHGDDTIYWDPADDLSNVLGGPGSDLLVFTNGATPTTFDLSAHGFEAAEGRFTDTEGNPWSTRTERYDELWRSDFVTIINDDGARAELDFDLAGAIWSTNFNQYDAQSRLDINVTEFDDGATASNDFDQDTAFDWASNWNRYAPDDLLDISVTIYDNGSTASNDHDQANEFSWDTNWVRYDVTGAVDMNVTVFDDGSTAIMDHDQSNASDQITDWRLLDALGRLDLNVVTYDDNSIAAIDYDQADSFDWASIWRHYTNNGVNDMTVITYDDGSVVIL